MSLKKYGSIILSLFLLVSLVAVSGCGTNYGGDTYHQTHVGYTPYDAVVTSVREAKLYHKNNNTATGAALGATTGGLLGSMFGSGAGQLAAAAGGVLAGGLAGAAIGEQTKKETGLEIHVRYNDGTEDIIVQGKSPMVYAGQQVRVLVGSDGTRRVQAK